MSVRSLALLSFLFTGFVHSETGSFLLPKYTSGDCSDDLTSAGWILLNFQTDNSEGERLTLRFCEGKGSPGTGARWPRGSYCVLRVEDKCPLSLTPTSITTQLSSMRIGSGTIPDINRVAESDFYKVNICCSTSVTSEPLYFNIKPPFSLIKLGAKCQQIVNTKVSEVAINHLTPHNAARSETFINLCLYERPQVVCAECDQLCVDEGCGCYEGFRLYNNTHCQDINECQYAACDHMCINTKGGYVCRCAEGFLLMEDDRTCTKFNKCLLDNGGCSHYCKQDHRGEAECSCEEGFVLDGKACNQLNLAGVGPVQSPASKVWGSEPDDYAVGKTSPVNQTQHPPPLFTTQRDYIVCVISLVGAVIVLLLVTVLLIQCRLLLCLCSCPKSAAKKRHSKDEFRNSISGPYIRADRVTKLRTEEFRNSISGPCVGDVAMDLLNRPKRSGTLLRDLPSRQQSVASLTQSQYTTNNQYNNSNQYSNTSNTLPRERTQDCAGYDSLSRHTPLITPYAMSQPNISHNIHSSNPNVGRDAVRYSFEQPAYDVVNHELDTTTYPSQQVIYDYEESPPIYNLDHYDTAPPLPPALDLIPDPESPPETPLPEYQEYKDPAVMFRTPSFNLQVPPEGRGRTPSQDRTPSINEGSIEDGRSRVVSAGAAVARITPVLREPVSTDSISMVKPIAYTDVE